MSASAKACVPASERAKCVTTFARSFFLVLISGLGSWLMVVRYHDEKNPQYEYVFLGLAITHTVLVFVHIVGECERVWEVRGQRLMAHAP